MTKPTISLLVLFTTAPCVLIGTTGFPSIFTFLATCIGTFLAAGSAGIFNHLVDSDIDQVMQRTQRRPLPAGKVSKSIAVFFATVLAVVSFCLLYFIASPLAAFIALAANAFYVLVYSVYLKRRTPQNIVIGGAAGAVGPLIGIAATDHTLNATAVLLFMIIFLWTPPHFWALALKYKKDYASANIPMFPVVYGDEKTRLWIFLYTLILLPTILAIYFLDPTYLVFTVIAFVATFYFCWLAYRLYANRSNDNSMSLFLYSCVYLFIIFAGVAVDRLFALL